MSKRKFDIDSDDHMIVQSMTEAQLAAVLQLQDELPTNYKCLAPLLQTIQQAYEAAAPRPMIPVKTRKATEFKNILEIAKTLGVDYKRDSLEHSYRLKETDAKGLSEHFAAVVKAIKTSDYLGTRSNESLTRTVLDLILYDRLQHLEDKDTFCQLILSAEVPVSVNIQDEFGNPEIINGRADWILGYGITKANTGSILMIVEAKGFGKTETGLTQMLIYMAAVHEARRGHTNNSVFGMLSDGTEFKFAFLDSNKKFHVSYALYWIKDQQAIISHIDTMLLDAIQSSPHTTPTKSQNKTLLRYRRYLETKWAFGKYAEDEVRAEAKDEDEDKDDIVDVVMVDKEIVMRRVRCD